MKKQSLLFLIVLIGPLLLSLTIVGDKWISKAGYGYTIYYTSNDNSNIEEYMHFFENGTEAVTNFFERPYNRDFNIYIHPDRASLDSAWQNEWSMPNFMSQCWMVASGVADKLDVISPKMWDSLACEHTYSNIIKTQNLITHELIHVFHGQLNESADFSNVTGIDWLVEGLATYASGQCDSLRILQVKNALLKNEIPKNLDQFWTGNLKYGLSGSVVMYLDYKYGREKLISLLPFSDIKDVLDTLETTELEILNGWEKYMSDL